MFDENRQVEALHPHSRNNTNLEIPRGITNSLVIAKSAGVASALDPIGYKNGCNRLSGNKERLLYAVSK